MKKILPLLLVAWSAAAAPLKPADVSANPAWLLHLDCDALRQTYIGQYLLYQFDKPEIHSNMMMLQSIFTFDFRTQLHGVTIYSDTPSHKDDVIIIYADFEPDRFVTVIRGFKTAETSTNNQHVIYTWMNNDKIGNGPPNYAVVKTNCIVLTRNRACLNTALAVLDGTRPDFAVGNVLPEMAAGAVPFVQVIAHNMDLLGSNPQMAVLKLAKAAKFQACESNEQLKAILTAEVEDENTAQQMAAVAQGMIALLGLQKDNPKAAGLAGGISIKQTGGTVTATAAISSTDLIGALQTYSGRTEKPKNP